MGACDRCHRKKQKCTFMGDQFSCVLCHRLQVVCSQSRQNPRLGRRPAAKTFPNGKMFIWGVEQHRYRNYRSESHPPPSIFNQWLKRVFWTDTAKDWAYGEDDGSIIGLPPERLPAAPTCLRTTSDALRTVMDADRFTAIHAPFMMGHTFASEFQISLYTILRFSAPILTEGYLAFLCLMTGYQNPLTARRDEPNMSKAANGLQTLRNVTITRDFEAACTLLLGQAMYVFNVLTEPCSSKARSIIRSSLISAKPWYEELIQDPQMDTVIFAPILIDTVECLVHREVPIVRLPIPNRIVVDRYVGLCSTLLPHLYDICQCSHALRKNSLHANIESQQGIHDRLAEIAQTIREWKPRAPHCLSDLYAEHEILGMVTQAKVYQLAALLIVHRLRYPFGVRDDTAISFAKSIFTEISLLARPARKESRALPVIMPLTLAMLEIQEPWEETLDSLSLFPVHRECALKLRDFVHRVRASRKSGYAGTWFELVETHLDVAVIP